jgi:hypothetical protein
VLFDREAERHSRSDLQAPLERVGLVGNHDEPFQLRLRGGGGGHGSADRRGVQGEECAAGEHGMCLASVSVEDNINSRSPRGARSAGKALARLAAARAAR